VAFLASTLCAAADNPESARDGQATSSLGGDNGLQEAVGRTFTATVNAPIAPDNRPGLGGLDDEEGCGFPGCEDF
jgi:hypothetical protein